MCNSKLKGNTFTPTSDKSNCFHLSLFPSHAECIIFAGCSHSVRRRFTSFPHLTLYLDPGASLPGCASLTDTQVQTCLCITLSQRLRVSGHLGHTRRPAKCSQLGDFLITKTKILIEQREVMYYKHYSTERLNFSSYNLNGHIIFLKQ